MSEEFVDEVVNEKFVEAGETDKKLAAAEEQFFSLSNDLEKKNKELAMAKGRKLEKLEEQIKKLQDKIKKKELEIKELKIKKKKEGLALLQKEIQSEEKKFMVEALELENKKVLRTIVEQARWLLELGKTRIMICKQEEEIKDILRHVVAANPSGWTYHEDVYKRYVFFRSDRLVVILQDSPTYKIDFPDLIAWIGLEQAVKYAVVDKTTLVNDIKAKEVNDKEGKLISLEDWFVKRQRSVGEAKVIVSEEDPVGRKKVVLVVKPELLGEPISNLPSLTNLTGHEINPLLAAGVEKVAQIRGFSGEQLMSIPKIGSIRAKKIIDEISQLSGRDPGKELIEKENGGESDEEEKKGGE